MSHRLLRLTAATAALLALAACGAGDDSSDRDGAAAVPGSGSAPEACATAYPLATGDADLADVTLRPADFPEPPLDATLCQTSSTLDDTITSAQYATESSATEILDAYEAQLGAIYEIARVDDGAGETVTGELTNGDFFQVTAREGAYSVAFGTE